MNPRILPLLGACVLLAAPALAQDLRSNAGFGALYRDFELDAQTGATAHLGVATDPRTGHIFVTAAAVVVGQPHSVFEFDGQGNLIRGFPQPAVHTTSAFGIRDLDFDGQSLIGGSEAGISVFSVTGALVNVLQTGNGPRAIQQPIAAAGVPGLQVPRAIAYDPAGNHGNGSFFVGDFDGPIVEIDANGTPLASWANQGWVAYGLAVDPVTGNLWVNSLPDAGDIAELDRLSMTPTGRFLPQVVPNGVQGGLSLASPNAGHHAPWPVEAALIQVTQADVDRVGIHRLHLMRGVLGWDEPQLHLSVNGAPPVAGNVPYRRGDTLGILLADPTAARTGQPCWTIVNFYLDAADAVTDLSRVLPGTGLLPEHRTRNAISVPLSTTFGIAAHVIGTPLAVPIPPSFPVATGDILRWQSVYLQPGVPYLLASSNEAHMVGQEREGGIVVAAQGLTSFHGSQGRPFWSVTSDTSHALGAILAVEFSFVGAALPAGAQHFDIDQDNMNDRFDGGNSPLPGCHGTYRNGADALCGLDYGAPGAWVVPACHPGPGQSAGVAFPTAPAPDGSVSRMVFRFTNFGPGKTFEFDCDTDGALPSGDQHAGMIVRITTSGSGLLTGTLRADPAQPDRAVVWFR